MPLNEELLELRLNIPVNEELLEVRLKLEDRRFFKLALRDDVVLVVDTLFASSSATAAVAVTSA